MARGELTTETPLYLAVVTTAEFVDDSDHASTTIELEDESSEAPSSSTRSVSPTEPRGYHFYQLCHCSKINQYLKILYCLNNDGSASEHIWQCQNKKFSGRRRFMEKKELYGRDPLKLFETYQEEWERIATLSDRRLRASLPRRTSIMNLSPRKAVSRERVPSTERRPVNHNQNLKSPKHYSTSPSRDQRVKSPRSSIY